MKKHTSRLKKLVLGAAAVFAAVGASIAPVTSTFAADNNDAFGFTMSPMKENMVLNPGETYQSSFTIHNPATHTKDFEYEISVNPFYVTDDYTNTFEQVGNYNEIVDWITIDSTPYGSLAPNEQKEIYFTVNVPDNAPGGGQYAAITVSSANATNEGDNSAVLEKTAIAHTVFAEITGDTVYSGEITEANVPSFMLSGNIYGESTIKNTGNVHGKATYTLTVTPLFSSEEAYTNAESPATHDVLPDRSYYSKTEWDGTPGAGIFNVKYVVDVEGVTTEVSKLVIICPIWMMILIAVIVVAIIAGVMMVLKKRK